MHTKITKRSIQIDDISLEYFLEMKNVKNLNLRIKNDCTVHLSAPFFTKPEKADAFVKSKINFIEKSISKFKEKESFSLAPKQYVNGETFFIQGRSVRLKVEKSSENFANCDGVYLYIGVKKIYDFSMRQKVVKEFYDEQCKEVFSRILNQQFSVFKKYGAKFPQIKIRIMKSKWGVCRPVQGIITLNKRLIETPRNCIEYVMMHELCHLVHPNHSTKFYSLLSVLMPDWKERKKTLEKWGI